MAHGGVREIRSDLGDEVHCVSYDSDDPSDAPDTPDCPSGPMLDGCAGWLEACALDELGTPVSWSIPEGTDTPANPPPGPFVSITCGAAHACALTADGTTERWGHDSAGETIPPS